MKNHTVISVQVSSTTGTLEFIASKAYEGFFFPAVGHTVSMAEQMFTVVSVDWDISQDYVRVMLESISLDDEELELFKRDWSMWGGDIDTEVT